MHTDWSLFFGSFHPLIVHIPIGILLFAALLGGVARYKRNRVLQSAISIALFTGSLGAALAAVSGYFLSAGGGYDVDTLFWHKWTGIAAAVLGFVAWWIRRNKKRDIVFLKTGLSVWLLSLCILFIIVGGHYGGTMTHGENYLTAHMPAFLRSVFHVTPRAQPQPLPAQLDSVRVFAHIIQPILSAKCVGCHNPGKEQGDLALNSPETIMKGGKSGNTLVPGDITKSELVYRVSLDPDNTKFMPPNNRTPLTSMEAGLLKWWVASGADFTKNIAESKVDEKTKYVLAFYLGFDEENDKKIILPEAAPADPNVVKQLREMKLVVRTLTAQSNLLDISFVMMRQSSPQQKRAALQLLLSVKEQVYRLDVSNCMLTGEEIKMIADLPNLNKLELQKNDLTDESLDPLKALQQLTSLNLGQNDITAKSIAVFQQMTALQKINLWQTRFTEEDVRQLQDTMKGIVVVSGE